jgi:hypothetical protein
MAWTIESRSQWLHETQLRSPGQLCHNAFQLLLTMICQLADYIDNCQPNGIALVLKQLNERWDPTRDGFAKLNFVLLVSCVAMLFNCHSP